MVLSLNSIRAFLAALLVPLSASATLAQPLLAPAEVVLYISPALKSTAFLGPLICMLKRVLIAPVETVRLDIAFSREMYATRTQLDVEKVAQHFHQVTAKDGGPQSFKYLLLPHDLKAPKLNYVFSTSFGNHTTAFHVGVVSTARLVGPTRDRQHGPDVTTARAYKLILKSVARLSGYQGPDRCVLDFPRNLDELDQKSHEFCPADREALVAAKILKSEERESGDCAPVAEKVPKRSLIADLRAR